MLHGFLFSQIGYDTRYPQRVIMRATNRNYISTNNECVVSSLKTYEVIEKKNLEYWGEIWGSHWWIAEFNIKIPNTYNISVKDNGNEIINSNDFLIKEDILWESSWRLATYDMLERRQKLAQKPYGWQDAGSLWQEANSHSSMLIGLCDALEFASSEMTDEERLRIEKQIINGCRYLILCQKEAKRRFNIDGPIVHDMLQQKEVIIPSDSAKASVAWIRCAKNVRSIDDAERNEWKTRSRKALEWHINVAEPFEAKTYHPYANGIPDKCKVPKEWATKELLMLAWAELELSNDTSPSPQLLSLINQIIKRQVPIEKQEDKLYGHFYSFDSSYVTEKAWTHNLNDNKFGPDVGGIYPFFILPLIEMCNRWTSHLDVGIWKETIIKFAYNFLLPACKRNPFFIIPQGVYPNEGLLFFCGTWHGMNAIYGNAAALCAELASFLEDDQFIELAVANLQWIAGLNAGVTKDSLIGSVISSMDISDEEALPCSMICGIGKRWAGGWLNTRGVICNGFSTGKSYKFDVTPSKENDGPHSFTDEDWIPHSAAFISGLSRLRKYKKK